MKSLTLSIGLSIVMLIACLSCHSGNEEKTYHIGISQCTTDDAWRKAMNLDMQVEASDYPELTLLFADAHDDSRKQVEQIREFIRRKVDLLIISPNEIDPITPVAVEAYRAGIPTILIDRKIHSDEYTTFIGADNYEIGRSAGFYVNSLVEGKTNVLEIWGLQGSSPAQERHRGFSDVLSGNDQITLKEIKSDWHAGDAGRQIAALDSLSSLDIVFAHNDMMALAAREAIEAKDPKAAAHIRFLGVDAMPGKGLGLEAVAQGRLTASFMYPTGGELAIRVASQILNQQPFMKWYALTTAVIDQTNAGTLYVQSEQVVDYQHQIEKQRTNLDQVFSEYHFLQNSVAIILLLMGLLLLSALYVVHINRKIRRKNDELHQTNQQVEQQKEKLSEAYRRIERSTAQKLQFFTNVSHEVKTPLTLILGPLNKLEQEAPAGSSFADDIHIIRKNADRLKRVIDQLLDFRKVESHKMNMRVCQVNLIPFIEEVKSCFDSMAASKQIDFVFHHEASEVFLWVDKDKMEKILANLLSNAFKFTAEGGVVQIHLLDLPNQISLSVEDNGKGISPEHIASVFDCFFTGDQNYVAGTGIGLHLTREFVRMHGGTIQVSSIPDVSTLFTVNLPKGKSHFDASCTFDTSVTEHSCGLANPDITEVKEILSLFYPYTVLVVEDDLDIQSYLQTELCRNFRVLTANNGNEALDLLLREEITMVVSDVMMPGMNGFDLCRQIKSDMALSHIPVMLLTALSDDSQRLYGFAGGADEYIQKPFHVEEVKLRIIKLLEERTRMRKAIELDMQSLATSSVSSDKVGSLDDLFMNRFLDLIATSYTDPDFSIEKGSEKLGLSRVHLYRKVKELTGTTPTDFLRNYRLKQAAALLRFKDRNVNEVAYATGFSSPAYFSKCFKAVYNVTPSEYVSSL